MNQNMLANLNVEMVADSLERGKSCDRDSAGMPEVEWRIGDKRNVVHRHRRVLGVKASFGSVPEIGVNAITGLEAANAMA